MKSVLRVLLGWLAALLWPGLTWAQTCPPPPAQPTPDQVQALMASAKDHGFLWKISRDGRTSYLYGSIHVGKFGWFMPGPKTLAALAASDTVALELDVLDPAVQTQLMAASQSAGAATISPTLQARIAALARKVCVPPASLAGQHPVMQVVTLTLFDARFTGLEVAFGSEIFLASFARGAGKSVVGLETVASQMGVLLEGSTAEIEESVAQGLAVLEGGKSRAVTSRMATAWANGNLRELENYAQWCECADTAVQRRALQRLNDGRNPGLADGIDRLVQSGKSVFAAVGALHMTGARALPLLMREKGYQVERIAF